MTSTNALLPCDITAGELDARLRDGKPLQVVDVRGGGEFAGGRIAVRASCRWPNLRSEKANSTGKLPLYSSAKAGGAAPVRATSSKGLAGQMSPAWPAEWAPGLARDFRLKKTAGRRGRWSAKCVWRPVALCSWALPWDGLSIPFSLPSAPLLAPAWSLPA